MKKYWKLIIVGLVVTSLSLVVYSNWEAFFEKPFKVVQLSKDNYIVNRTEVPYLDTIVSIGLSEFKLKNTVVVIKALTPAQDSSTPDMELKAYVEEHNGQFLIYIKPTTRKESILILSHEMIHIAQFLMGEVKVLKDGVLWNKEVVYSFNTPYNDRPWENQAFALQDEFALQIEKKLY